jgi:DUF4097 and DUF4098 domain-containing protein YvlB
MKSICLFSLIALCIFLSASTIAFAQQKSPETTRPPQLVRTTSKHELRRFAYGGTVTLVGAPEGSITIEGWSRSEVEIRAEIQLRADTEEDLDRLAAVNGIVLDEDSNHIRILTTGTHDKAFMKAVAKKFPKTLLGLPWKIDYRIRVPMLSDLEINAGRGPVNLTGVEGDIQLAAADGDVDLKLSGGALATTLAKGNVTLTISDRTWRRGGADIRVALGDVTVNIPPGFNADIDAEVLRSGQIVDAYGGLEPRERLEFTPQKMKARSGAGGAFFQFTVGDGKISVKKQTADSRQ